MSDFERLKQAAQAGKPLKIEDLPASPSSGTHISQPPAEPETRKPVSFRTYLPVVIILAVFYVSLLVMIIIVLVAIANH